MGKIINRKLLKAISWRFWGTLDTVLWGWLFSGDSHIGFSIGGFELITKISLYYGHEWIWERWAKFAFWQKRKNRYRHLAKSITWRAVGTIDTIVLAWIISGNPLIGLKVGAAEVITKIGLFYLHERIWHAYFPEKTVTTDEKIIIK
ncbi:DUF2061 domain-containing protein [Flammeovirga kamogawensis]|uniref:DUF2061 domain-containing protein n=1 Tax=Flammeovirga kamogawensis TaxID=373891 RepID=A0ABX8GXZ2_9BACT|nr:DUF2061 domain-containing protein [Flammeovirga kamogawensis]MBB6458907.1 putative membrane protein [Flammeovirga kamogawensis]QWG08488.1 DUF2061 domain-containing protein [Flammeovirga kamogawensis]TRX66783.1 DUF2061 domain-containing protein [Flammeovirga kamogawensis]